MKVMMIGVVFPLILLFIRASTESLSRAIHAPSERGVWAFPDHISRHHLDSNWSHLPGVHVNLQEDALHGFHSGFQVSFSKVGSLVVLSCAYVV